MARPLKEKKKNICELCNKEFFTIPSKNRQFCSKTCSQQYKGKNKEWLAKREKTNLEKYGEKVAIKSKQVYDKYKQTMLEKYGAENPFSSEEIKNKINHTIKTKYGGITASQNDKIKSKISASLKGRVLDRNNFIEVKWEKLMNYQKISGMMPLFDKEYLENNKLNHQFKNKFKFKCDKCNEITEVYLSNGYLPSCKCSEYKGYSLVEDEILFFLSQYIELDQILLNRRDILPNKMELDIYIPSINLAIEVNGVYWHSESMGKYRNYHLYKTEKCEELGIDLIHVLDYEWIFKKPIVQSILLNKINKIKHKIHARKCKILEISNTTIIKSFLKENHIQGYAHSKISLGLYYNDELVSIMTWGKNRFKKESNEWEMVRFCNKLNTHVVGGASKLFKHFNKHFNIEKLPIISFSDRRFFKGKLYENLDFKFESNTFPSYIYWKDSVILNRMSCQKHKLSKFLDTFDPLLSEYENMKMNGWRRVWDSGNTKWIYNK